MKLPVSRNETLTQLVPGLRSDPDSLVIGASEVQGERRAETRSSYAEPQPSLAVASQMQWQRYNISKVHCPTLADSKERKLEIMWNFCDSGPFTVKVGGHLEFADQFLVYWRFLQNLLILQLWGEIDAVVLTDVFDGLWGKFLGFGRNAHLVEDVAAGCQIATEGSFRDAGEFGEFLLADEKMFVVVINHIVLN